MNYKVCAVVVTYNRLQLLKGALASLFRQTYKPDIVVINNGSTDGTTEYLQGIDGITVISQKNVGGAGGFFTGIKHAVENSYDFSWVMDDDVIVESDALESLLTDYNFLIRQKEKIGFLCSMVQNVDGYMVNNPAIDDVRLNPTYHASWNKYLGTGIVGVKSATFVSVLIPTEVTTEVGLPIKEFFIWGDDTEYTTRISKKYNCYLCGNSIVTHLRVGDKPIRLIELTDKNRIRMYENSIRNEIYLNRKGYYDSKHKIIFILWHFITFGRLLFSGSALKLKVFVRGIFNGFRFNPKIQYPAK